MEKQEHKYNRITLSIPTRTNALLEELQQHLRKNGSRRFKSQIIHEALDCLGESLGLDHANDGATCVEDDVVSLDFFPEGECEEEGGTGVVAGEAADLG
jgi:predicted Zn-dependent protease